MILHCGSTGWNVRGAWTSPGDFGKRRESTPPTWSAGGAQYGLLTIWEIGSDGCYINHQKVGSRTVEDLKIMDKNTILVRIGVKDDAVHKGGFNIFGKKFGDYGQDIIMSIAYSERVQGSLFVLQWRRCYVGKYLCVSRDIGLAYAVFYINCGI